MRIDYISDNHLDFYIGSSCNDAKIQRLISRIYTSSSGAKVCIIAGDLGHYNASNVKFLRILKQMNGYDLILKVHGNHSFYNISRKMQEKYPKLFDRTNELKDMIAKEEDIVLLDGDIYDYNGVRFGGAMGWYDCSYYYRLTQGQMYGETMMSHWCNYSNDSNLIPGLMDPRDLFEIEIEKIKKVVEAKPDVMITHVCPVIDTRVIDPKHKLDRGTGYYCFDGEKYLDGIKYWVYGHMHSVNKTSINGTELVRNPVGYPTEHGCNGMAYFEV